MTNYTKKEFEKLREINLAMAQHFVDFCKQRNLLCYFCGGGCIGAIRHNGFIPWDDDLDFFMPRRDYQALENEWIKESANTQYKLCKPSDTYFDRNQFITIRDSCTTMIKPYQKDLDIVHGVGLDIFPIDGLPNSILDRKKQVLWATIYSLFCTRLVPTKHGKAAEICAKILLAMFPFDTWKYKIWKYAEKQMSTYAIENCQNITELCAGPGYMKNRYPKKAFETAIWVDFDNTKMPIPVGYDIYLKIAFGDYMKLPPNRNRIPHHDTVKIDFENSYEKYKGIYYCVD